MEERWKFSVGLVGLVNQIVQRQLHTAARWCRLTRLRETEGSLRRAAAGALCDQQLCDLAEAATFGRETKC
jgi:hypothetical protein